MKEIYNINTGVLYPWPRCDEGEVEGLAPHLLPMTIIQEPPPTLGRWQTLVPSSPQINIQARTITRGWTVTEVEPVVTMRSLRFALITANLYNAVEGVVMTTAEGKVWWQSSQTVRRNHDVVTALASSLNLTDAQIDALFESAAEIEATL